MSDSSNILLDIEFDGARFYGWQQQADRRTVQGVLLEHLRYLYGESVVLTGAGRTDRGVHALHMPASFSCEQVIPESRLLPVLSAQIPGDIQLLGQRQVAPGFNARFSARSRSYRYLVSLRSSAFTRDHAWFLEREPEIDSLQHIAGLFKGVHDFTAFCKTRSLPESALCEVEASYWQREGDWLMYHVTANRFLHHMVRAMVGLMLAIERQEVRSEVLEEALKSGDRQLLPKQAPPQGLYLTGVEYPDFVIGEVYKNKKE
jgi:tRNA pseudouridine38-40 synthase